MLLCMLHAYIYKINRTFLNKIIRSHSKSNESRKIKKEETKAGRIQRKHNILYTQPAKWEKRNYYYLLIIQFCHKYFHFSFIFSLLKKSRSLEENKYRALI